MAKKIRPPRDEGGLFPIAATALGSFIRLTKLYLSLTTQSGVVER